MAAVPNESGFILEVPLKRYCAQVKDEQFAARFGDPSQFVILEMRCSRPLVGTVGQVPLVSSTATSRKMVQSSPEPSATTRQGGRMPSKAKSVSLSKNFSPYIGLTGRPAAAAALQEIQGFRQQLSFELAVHIEHIANAYDVALADFNRGRMQHRPGRF